MMKSIKISRIFTHDLEIVIKCYIFIINAHTVAARHKGGSDNSYTVFILLIVTYAPSP